VSTDRLLYFIGFTVRSGSTWLCGMLNSTGVAGYAHEHYYKIAESAVEDGWHRYRNKDIGIKLNIRQIKELWPLAVKEGQPKLITLFRHNRWQAAVSTHRAVYSKVWVNPLPGYETKGRDYSQGKIPFDRERIATRYRLLQQEEQDWREWREENDLAPLELWYEDMCEHPVEVARQVLEYLGISYAGPIRQTTQKQRTAESEEWAKEMEQWEQSTSNA